MIVRRTLEVRLKNGPQHAYAGVLKWHLLMFGLELDGIEFDRPALGFGSSRFQLHQYVLNRAIREVLVGVPTRWEPGDVTGLVADDICKVHGDRVGVLLLGRF